MHQEKKNSCQCVGLRYVGRFLMPIVSVCCLQAWAAELVSTPGGTNILKEAGTYTASQDLTFGALQVAASPVVFDLSANPSRKVVFDGTAPDNGDVFSIRTKGASVTFKGGEWGAENPSGYFYCGGEFDDTKYGENNVLLDNCVWTNLNRVLVGSKVKKCVLTLDNNSRIHAQRCFLMQSGSHTESELHVLGGSGLYLSTSSTAFQTDNGGSAHSGTVTVSGDGSIIDAKDNNFIVGQESDGHLLVVSNNASVVAKELIIGNNATATGSRVLVADGATFTVEKLSVKNSGCGMTVSNATLTVDSVGGFAIQVGRENGTGGAFVLSGENTHLEYPANNQVEVFASDSGNAEFCIENEATWNLGITLRSATKTSNSVFRVASGGALVIQDGTGTLEFGPGTGEYNPALSVSNRFEVCDGGSLQLRRIRLNGNGNEFVVSNATVTFDRSTADKNQIRIGYDPGADWEDSWSNRDCALVLKGNNPKIDAPLTSLFVDSGSALRFEIPAEGYADGVIPLQVKKLTYNSLGKMEVDCSAFLAKGGKLTLMTVEDDDGLREKAAALIDTARATLPEGCTLTVENKKLVLRCPRRRFVFSIR